ncbi:MAG: bacillithiol biosynthesis BshC [Planctomycetes bacterium]|nr:bacillithiol biosynthesis BshC [Planctomycetota bacterium]
MSYRVEKLPLTTARSLPGRSGTMARIPLRRTKLPKSAFANFQILARRMARNDIPHDADLESAYLAWLRQAGAGKRQLDALRSLTRDEALAIVVPLVKGVAAPRMDEVLRIVAGLELADQLRSRRMGKVVTLLWPALEVGEQGDNGQCVIMQRSGEFEDVGFRGGDTEKYLKLLRSSLPGTGFSALLLDQIARAADTDPDLFKARLLVKYFEDDCLAVLPPSEGANFEYNLRRLFLKLPLLGRITQGPLAATVPPGEPVPFPGISATIIEGKVESWLQKFGLTLEEVLAGEAKAEEVARRQVPEDVGAAIGAAKEKALSEILRFELGVDDLGWKPATEVRNALNNFDMGCDRLKARAMAEAAREIDTNRKQLGKLFQYLLPDGRPQQESVSLFHYLDFYGPDFLSGLRNVLQVDDLRHQAVYLAPATGT